MATDTKNCTGLDPNSLVSRTAVVIYLASLFGNKQAVAPFEALHPVEQGKFIRMAKAALTEALREPVAA